MSAAAANATSFDSVDPGTGKSIGSFRIHTDGEVSAAVEAARPAAVWWEGLGFDGRETRLREWARILTIGMDKLAALIHQENGLSLIHI